MPDLGISGKKDKPSLLNISFVAISNDVVDTFKKKRFQRILGDKENGGIRHNVFKGTMNLKAKALYVNMALACGGYGEQLEPYGNVGSPLGSYFAEIATARTYPPRSGLETKVEDAYQSGRQERYQTLVYGRREEDYLNQQKDTPA